MGVTGGMRDAFTPTWNAIELSSPVAFADDLEMGELNSWHSVPPPSVRDEGLKNWPSPQGEEPQGLPGSDAGGLFHPKKEEL